MPFFSIVIPAYNREQFIQPLISSIRKQTYDDYEIIIVDDGSSDNTKQVVSGLMNGEPRLRYIHQQNAERAAARNNGIKNAIGNYVLFIDSDDIMLPNYLSDLNQLIIANPSYNFYSGRYLFDINGKKVQTTNTALKSGEHTIETVLQGNPFGCNFCIKKDNPKLVLFNEDRTLATTEDWMFLVENLFNDKLFLGDFIGLYMVQHDGRSMQDNDKIIGIRERATKTLVQKIPFTPHQQKTIWAYTWSFCATHYYLAGNRKKSLQFIKKAIEEGGRNNYFNKLHLKFFAGRKFINLLKKIGAN